MSNMGWAGLGLVVLAALFMWREHRILSRSVVVQGTVTGHAKRESKGKTYYAPIVAYATPDGRKAEFTPSLYSLERAAIGSTMNIAYTSEGGTPVNERLARFSSRYGPALIVMGIGLLLLSLALGFQYGDGWIERQYPATPAP